METFSKIGTIILLASAAPAFAGDEHPVFGGGDTDVSVPVDVANQITTGSVSNSYSSKSRAWGLGGGDMDINDFYRTYGILFGLWQDSKVNPLALAAFLQRQGNYKAAAMLMCEPRGVYKAFGGKEECVELLSIPPAEPPPLPSPPPEVNNDDEDNLRREFQSQLELLEERLTNTEPDVKIIRQYDPAVQQRLDEDAERRAKAREILTQAKEK